MGGMGSKRQAVVKPTASSLVWCVVSWKSDQPSSLRRLKFQKLVIILCETSARLELAFGWYLDIKA